MITKKEVLALCNEPSQKFIANYIDSDKRADIQYLDIVRTEDNRDREEFTLLFSWLDSYKNKTDICAAVLSNAGTKNNGSCFFGDLTHFAKVCANKKFHLSDSRKVWGLNNEDFRIYWQTVDAIKNKYLVMIQKKSA